jgi:hypothetical protein
MSMRNANNPGVKLEQVGVKTKDFNKQDFEI